jgi:hypothetical protein
MQRQQWAEEEAEEAAFDAAAKAMKAVDCGDSVNYCRRRCRSIVASCDWLIRPEIKMNGYQHAERHGLVRTLLLKIEEENLPRLRGLVENEERVAYHLTMLHDEGFVEGTGTARD